MGELKKAGIKDYLTLHFIVLIWGFTAILGKLITVDAAKLVWYRLLIAVISLFILLLVKSTYKLPDKRRLSQYFGVGLVIALHWVFFYHSIKVSNVAIGVVCLSSSTFFTAIIEPFVFKRKMLWYQIILGLVVIACLYSIFSISTEYTLGIIYGIFSALCSALFTIFNGRLSESDDAVRISAYELLGGFFFLSIYQLFTGAFTIQNLTLTNSDLLYLILLGTVCTAFAFAVSVNIMRILNPFTVVLSINLEPVYSIILAFFIFGEEEQMSLSFYIATVIILMAIIANGIIVNRIAKNR